MTKQDPLKIAAVQMRSTSCIDENLASAAILIEQAKLAGAQMILLPEYFAIMAKNETDKLQLVEKHGQGKVQSFLSSQAKQQGLWIIGGTHPVESDDLQRPYARCYVYNSNGERVCWYDKIHLFDVAVKDKHKNYQESRFSRCGSQVVSFESPWGKIGLAVCYDVRFPELFRALIKQGASVLLMPAAFTYTTGKVHWEVLLKARAIENLCFVVASAQGGLHDNGRETWGHSCIISSWGKILDSVELESGFAIASLNFIEQKKLRSDFPVLNHQKL